MKWRLNKKDVGAYIIDVCESWEWEQSHIPEAVWIPLGHLDNRLDKIPRDKEIVVVCRSGARSYIGLEILRKAGFKNSSSMAGGLNAWQAAGYPIEDEKKEESQ